MNDILLGTDSDDLDFSNGDFLIGDSGLQNQKRILMDNKNDWKQNPTTGVGLLNYLDDENPEDLFAAIREEFKADGILVNQIYIGDDGKFKIDAK